MTTVAKAPRTRKPQVTSRVVRVLQTLDFTGANGEIQITMTKGKKVETDRYWLDRLAADFGTGFQLEKQAQDSEENETYHVCLNGPENHCDCKGFSAHSHCKHVDALKKLTALGKL